LATRVTTPTALEIPERLGRFQVIAELGTGGMGQILLAVQRGAFASNKIVVIKKIRKDALDKPEFLNMFVDEARIAMRLSHPNIVNTFDFVAEEESLYLTMEFLEGHSLLHVLRKVGRDAFPLDLHLWILTRVLAALSYMHTLRDLDGGELCIVHRDVSPSNVILTHGGEVKLVDFGIAQAAGRLSVTQNGTLKGKIGYMSPEQCRLEPATMRSDIYAVGVMLWEALTKQRRRVGKTAFEALQARLRGNEPHALDLWPEAPMRLVEIVDKALAMQPVERYATAADFQRDLEAYLASGSSLHDSGSATLTSFLGQHLGPEIAALRKTIQVRIAADRASLAQIPGAETISDAADDEGEAEPTLVSGDHAPVPVMNILSAPLAATGAFDVTAAATTSALAPAVPPRKTASSERMEAMTEMPATVLTSPALVAAKMPRQIPRIAWAGLAVVLGALGGRILLRRPPTPVEERRMAVQPAARVSRDTAMATAIPPPPAAPLIRDVSVRPPEVVPPDPVPPRAAPFKEAPPAARPIRRSSRPDRKAEASSRLAVQPGGQVSSRTTASMPPPAPSRPPLPTQPSTHMPLPAQTPPRASFKTAASTGVTAPRPTSTLKEESPGMELGHPTAPRRLPIDEKDPFTP